MSEHRTKETEDSRSFEERVFARFDTIDERFERVEGRLTTMEIKVTKLEARQYDTKPIWERALAEIAELSRAISEQRSEFQTGMENLRTDLRSEFQTDLRSELQTGMENLGTDLRSEFQTGMENLRTDLRSEFQTGMENLRTDLRSEFQTGIGALRTEMKAGFATIRHEMEHGLRGVARTVDTLNHNVLQMQTYQRYVDARLEILETKVE